MTKSSTLIYVAAIVAFVIVVILVGHILKKQEPILLQGCVECATYRASSKIAGRIDTLFVEQGDMVNRGDILYRLTTPELDAKLQQVEALRSAALAMDRKAITGAREQQRQEALNMWQKAQAGLSLAEKSYNRVSSLYAQGVIPAQQLDEATAQLEAMRATESAAKAQYDLVRDGASIEDKEAAAAQLRQAQGAVNEVETYIDDALVYAPASGEISTIAARGGELVSTGYPVVMILDNSDMWVSFNVKETLLPKITIGKQMSGYVPALDRDISLRVSYISVEADFATWSATRTRGGFDIRTFEVKATPQDGSTVGLRAGMSVIVNWNRL